MQTFQRDETREHAAAIREQVAALRVARDNESDTRMKMLRVSVCIGELERTAQRLEAMVQRDEDRERKETAAEAPVAV